MIVIAQKDTVEYQGLKCKRCSNRSINFIINNVTGEKSSSCIICGYIKDRVLLYGDTMPTYNYFNHYQDENDVMKLKSDRVNEYVEGVFLNRVYTPITSITLISYESEAKIILIFDEGSINDFMEDIDHEIIMPEDSIKKALVRRVSDEGYFYSEILSDHMILCRGLEAIRDTENYFY